MSTTEVRAPRTLSPEESKAIRARRDEILPRIDALLAEFPADFGSRKGGAA